MQCGRATLNLLKRRGVNVRHTNPLYVIPRILVLLIIKELKRFKGMENYFDIIKNKLHYDLLKSSKDYLNIGLDLFYKEFNNHFESIQPPIGNLCISIELLLKSVIAYYNPLLVFTNLPLELKVYFSTSNSKNEINYKKYDIDLRSFSFNSIELNDSIAIFNILFPKSKQILKPYFQILSKCRNISVHASFPKFQKYDLMRITYLAIKLFDQLEHVTKYKMTVQDQKFIEEFIEEKAEKVRQIIERAKENAKKTKNKEIEEFYGWDEYYTKCPICGSYAKLYGYTDEISETDGETYFYSTLEFYAQEFECSSCELQLFDIDEMKLVNMDTVYDRSEDTNNWISQIHESNKDELLNLFKNE